MKITGLLLVVVGLVCVGATRLRTKLKSQSRVRLSSSFFSTARMHRLNVQFGKVHWNETEMPMMKPDYPKSIKPIYRFIDRNCMSDEQFKMAKEAKQIDSKQEQDCIDRQAALDLAITTVMKEEIQDPNSAIYYVNTRRVQKKDNSKQYMKKDFLNQFTFAVCPMDKPTAEEGKFIPIILQVVVPIDPEVEPYVLKKCIFDFAKYKEKDLKDDKEDSCDYIYEAADDKGLRLQLTDLHAQYWANLELDDEKEDQDM